MHFLELKYQIERCEGRSSPVEKSYFSNSQGTRFNIHLTDLLFQTKNFLSKASNTSSLTNSVTEGDRVAYRSVSLVIDLFVSSFICTRTSSFTLACSLQYTRKSSGFPSRKSTYSLFQNFIDVIQLLGIILDDIFL